MKAMSYILYLSTNLVLLTIDCANIFLSGELVFPAGIVVTRRINEQERVMALGYPCSLFPLLPSYEYLSRATPRSVPL